MQVVNAMEQMAQSTLMGGDPMMQGMLMGCPQVMAISDSQQGMLVSGPQVMTVSGAPGPTSRSFASPSGGSGTFAWPPVASLAQPAGPAAAPTYSAVPPAAYTA